MKKNRLSKEILIEIVSMLLLGILACGLKLKIITTCVLFVVAIIMYPQIVKAHRLLERNDDRFTNLTSYMENMIVTFKNNPKILLSLKATKEFCDGEMQLCIERAIDVIENDATSPDIYKKAFAIIEDEFRTSRLKSLHKFLISVEQGNSVNYQENIDNLYYDIHSWVTRIFNFKKELRDKKNKIVITIVASVAIITYFTRVMVSMQAAIKGANLTGGILYQVGTAIFLITLICLFTAIESKLNGVKLIEDMANYDEDKVYKAVEKVEHSKNSHYRRSEIKRIKKELLKEFPAWLRDVSVNLQNMVVVKAIEESARDATPLFKMFSRRFLKSVEKDPTSMKPYENFFGVFKMPELLTSIKTLYSIHSLSEEDAVRQINNLTVRNQDLIARSEELRLNDSIAGISFLSVIPMLVMSFKLMADMVVVLFQFLSVF